MPTRPLMPGIRGDDRLDEQAIESDSPAGPAADPAEHDAWVRAMVQESLTDPRPGKPHDEAMQEVRELIDAITGPDPEWKAPAITQEPLDEERTLAWDEEAFDALHGSLEAPARPSAETVRLMSRRPLWKRADPI